MKQIEAFEVAVRVVGLYLFVESLIQGADRIPYLYVLGNQYGLNASAGNTALIIAFAGLALFGLLLLFRGRTIASFVYEHTAK